MTAKEEPATCLTCGNQLTKKHILIIEYRQHEIQRKKTLHYVNYTKFQGCK